MKKLLFLQQFSSMLILFKKVIRKIKKTFSKTLAPAAYDFNKSNPLGDNGERVDIQLTENLNFDELDMYQKNHWKRYEFAKESINTNDVCGDFACGTGYGSVLLAEKAKSVTGADLNAKVITAITSRYKDYQNVCFLNEDLLKLKFTNEFDTIISFETLEHFKEKDIKDLLIIFYKAIKKNGKLIFSTPYMQEQSEAAVKAGFHLTFYINEEKIFNWLKEAGFNIESIQYQNYDTHQIVNCLEKKEFIVCVAQKNNG